MAALCKNSKYLAFIFFAMALTACDSKVKEDVAAIRAIKEAEQKTQLEREKSDHKAMDDMAKGLARPVTKYPF